MFVVDPAGKLVYDGAIDDRRSANPADAKIANNYVRAALSEATAGKPVTVASTTPYGCSVEVLRPAAGRRAGASHPRASPDTVVLPLAAAAVCAAGCGPAGERPLQGYIEGEYVRVAAPFAGTLQQLTVKRGDQVAAGCTVVRARAGERGRRAPRGRGAACGRRGAPRQSEERASGRPRSRPSPSNCSRRARCAICRRRTCKRQQQLFASGFVSSAALDDAQAQFKRDEAHVKELDAAVATTKMPARVDEIRAAEADARAARDVLAQSEWRLAQRAVAAPAAGLVHDTYYVVGDWVPAGSPVASVLPPGNVKVRFYVAGDACSGASSAGRP